MTERIFTVGWFFPRVNITDLLGAISYAFRMEVPVHQIVSGDTFTALLRFVHLLESVSYSTSLASFPASSHPAFLCLQYGTHGESLGMRLCPQTSPKTSSIKAIHIEIGLGSGNETRWGDGNETRWEMGMRLGGGMGMRLGGRMGMRLGGKWE